MPLVERGMGLMRLGSWMQLTAVLKYRSGRHDDAKNRVLWDRLFQQIRAWPLRKRQGLSQQRGSVASCPDLSST